MLGLNWKNTKLVLQREIRDQLRDRRTLFMIAVLPILLYPLLGMSFFQISQFMREESTTVLVAGARDLEDLPPLFENQQFAPRLFSEAKQRELLELHFARGGESFADPAKARKAARQAVQEGEYDAAVYFPPDFADRLEAFRAAIRRRAAQRDQAEQPAAPAGDPQTGPPGLDVPLQVPSPEIIHTTANEKSQIAFARLSEVLRRWTEEIGQSNLEVSGVPPKTAKPFALETADVADDAGLRGAATWAKILPVLLLLWALTGAFYPAIDLCAGEKERGTLETLLSSPAERGEIVVGKLLTVMIFSMVTAVLNLISAGITGWAVLSQVKTFGAPPPMAPVWLGLALVPMAALFSALCLALAALARSTKEGQYYLMPLLLITMPLAVLPMAPGVELNLGNSLIPVTGVVLLLRAALEGNQWAAIQYFPPVAGVTLACCLLSVRWAIDQFNTESVLFRESERLDVGLWFQHLLRDRQPTPPVAAAIFCGVLILTIRFFFSFAMPQPVDFRGFAVSATVTQLVVILTPALIMTVMLTSSPRQTLLLRVPNWPALVAVPVAGLLAIVLHPAARSLQMQIVELYPVSDQMHEALKQIELLLRETPLWQKLLVVGLLPAVCEELAFRGFILSGFRHLGYKWRAIVYSSIFFGLTHAILQQSLVACLVGVVIGYIAVQSGSLLPCIVFHLVHNSLGVLAAGWTPEVVAESPLLRMLMTQTDGVPVYRWSVVVAGTVAGLVVLHWFSGLRHPMTEEERLQARIRRASAFD
jgi:sodium transport system permease protein